MNRQTRLGIAMALEDFAALDVPRSIPKADKAIDHQLQRVAVEAAVLARLIGAYELMKRLEIMAVRCRTCGSRA